MHLIKDENGNLCAHAHEHVHSHAHSYEHSHAHNHEHGQEENQTHCHGDDQDCECTSSECKNESCDCGCGHEHSEKDQNTALLTYMLQHNESHAAELDQMASKLSEAGMDKAAEQIHKAVDEFQKGNMYLGVALAIVKEQ